MILLISARKVVWEVRRRSCSASDHSPCPANPLYQGPSDLLTLSPLLSTFAHEASKPSRCDPIERGSASANWHLNAVPVASGLKTLSAPDIYPDHKTWRILDPDHQYRTAWDRYANLTFVPAPSGALPKLTLLGTFHASLAIAIDPCGAAAQQLDVGFVVSPAPLTGQCLTLSAKTSFNGAPTYIYRGARTRQ